MAEDHSKTNKAKTRNGASSRSAIEKLAEARFLIDEEAANSADAIAYVHAVLCQISPATLGAEGTRVDPVQRQRLPDSGRRRSVRP